MILMLLLILTIMIYNKFVVLHCLINQEFLRRFASIPDMLELDHLTVSGDVTFGKGVSLKVSTGAPKPSHFSVKESGKVVEVFYARTCYIMLNPL